MNRIKDILKEKGITQQELADKLGITRSGIVKTLAGNPSQETLEKIANILDVPMWQIFASPEEVNNNLANDLKIICPHCNKSISLKIGVKDKE